MTNLHIRKAARIADVRLWQVADRLGISEPTLGRWLRRPLSPEREALILEAIRSIEKEEGNL